jgi:cytochrome c
MCSLSALRSTAFGVVCTLLQITAVQAGDVEAGKKVFKKCTACHTIERDGKTKVGPNLFGIVGKPVASNPDYAKKYSKALKTYTGIWSSDRLDVFLLKPKAEVKGTRMSFAGLKKGQQRADLIAYLNENSDHPLDLADQSEKSQTQNASAEPEFGVLVADIGAEETYNACTACHSERIVAQQGLSKKDWMEVLVWMVDEQEMDEIEDPDYSLIVNYLAKNYNLDRPNFPRK